MTHRLYYHDSYQQTFDATVVSCAPEGDAFAIVLDRTAFYPTSGGQPFDTGTLNEVRVRDVVDREDGGVVHLGDRSVEVGREVRGQIDWARRFDHMQQHTGQHLLSAAFDRVGGVRTESFHLGAGSATIDLAREVSRAEIDAAEQEANRIIWEDRPVTIRFATEAEARAMPLRKEAVRSGPLRLIEIQDFDLSACGGTHVARTGVIGVIVLASWERFRKGTRVEFLCGGRAVRRFNQWRDALAAITQRLSVHPGELAAAVEKLQIEAKALQKALRAQQDALAVHESRALVARGEQLDDRILVVEALEGWDAAGLKALAVAAAQVTPTAAVALFSRTEPPVAVIAAGVAARVDAAAVLRTLTTAFGGRGGGKRDLAQGGGFSAPVDTLVDAVRTELRASTAA